MRLEYKNLVLDYTKELQEDLRESYEMYGDITWNFHDAVDKLLDEKISVVELQGLNPLRKFYRSIKLEGNNAILSWKTETI